jgi:hypothetical protein
MYQIRSNSVAEVLWFARQMYIARIQQQIIRRKDNLDRRAAEVLRPGERFASTLDANGLGVWVGVESLRPKQLLEELQRLAFSTFELLGYQEYNGRYWAHFRFM